MTEPRRPEPHETGPRRTGPHQKESHRTGPRQVAIAGAGVLGLSVAWFLQEYGIEVTVYDQAEPGAGASWGNAGWITPAMAAPLPEPALLRTGLAALLRPGSPVSVPLRPDPALAAFLWSFGLHCTARRWAAGLTALAPLSRQALTAYDALADGGVTAPVHEAAPLLAAYRTAAGREPLLAELRHAAEHGNGAQVRLLDGDEVAQAEPALSGVSRAAVLVSGQRYLDPAAFVTALAASVRDRGGKIESQRPVTGLRADPAGVVLSHPGGEARHDAVVLATGAWLTGGTGLGRTIRRLGVRLRVQSGRGYSFAMPLAVAPHGPVYFPAARLACTPREDGLLRVAGVMEFAAPDVPARPRQFAAMARAAAPLLAGARPGERTEEWLGARPCTPDGLPVLGATQSDRVFVAGGHGMWGITLGPASGRLLAAAIATGTAPAELSPFSPLR
jgi:D-amino-acid dehydrogenase